MAVIRKLNPIIKGWAAYYRTVVSSEVFSQLDHYLWKLAYKWARRTHPNKPKRWVVRRYFGQFNKFRRDRWVFGDRDSGAYLLRFSWTNIVRHQNVKDRSSPDDPALADYWADRRRRRKPPLDPVSLRLLLAQKGRCLLCGDFLLHADREPQSPAEWEQWLKATRKAFRRNAVSAAGSGTLDETAEVHLVHVHCDRQHRAEARKDAALLPARTPSGLA
jgi:RNA-directed DNA polymerase